MKFHEFCSVFFENKNKLGIQNASKVFGWLFEHSNKLGTAYPRTTATEGPHLCVRGVRGQTWALAIRKCAFQRETPLELEGFMGKSSINHL